MAETTGTTGTTVTTDSAGPADMAPIAALAETADTADTADTAGTADNRTLAAVGFVLGFAVVISFVDNVVAEIAREVGLWQFHLMRTVFAMMVYAGLAALPLALRLRPRRWRPVIARSLALMAAMLLYFGALGFLPVAQAAAGLFTAPIFVLLIGRLAYGHAIGPARVIAALTGFAGVLMVLEPDPANLSPVLAMPLLAGAFYALANIATREWCAGETAAALTLVYMLCMGLAGALGLAVLWLFDPVVPAGANGFLLRGWVWPGGWPVALIAVQALGTMLGVALVIRAYQLAEANRVAIFEYVLLPCSVFWGWVMWGQQISGLALAGMVVIVASGAAMAWRGTRG